MTRLTASRQRAALGTICALAVAASLIGICGKLGAEEKSFLWKVSSGKSAVYLLGSIHFMRKDSYPLKPAIERAFESANKLVLEIDLQAAGQENMRRRMLLRGMSSDGKTLKQSVSPEAFDLAEKRAKELGLDIQALSRFKPWFAALTISAVKLQKLGFDPSYGVDRYFSDRAKKDDKVIVGLESFDDQLGIFDRMSESDQEKMLLQTLKDLDRMDGELNRIVRSWMIGDGQAMEDFVLGSFKDYPGVYQKLITDRNRRWLPQIEGFLSQGGSAMVVVGAGHLIGRDGIIQLLKERGYTVEQL